MDIENHRLDRDLNALEHRLTAWRPSAGALDRDRMLYDAGRAAARDEGRRRAWRLTIATLVFMTIGLGAPLARERARRMALELDRAALTLPSPPSPAPPAETDLTPIEPPAPSSYFARTARLATNPEDPAWPDAGIEREPRPMGPTPPEMLPQPVLSRVRDWQRVLDL